MTTKLTTTKTAKIIKLPAFNKPTSKKGLCFGVGINDMTSEEIRPNGKNAKFYATWSSCLQRCFSKSWHSMYPTYKDCTVAEEWLLLSNFKKWFDANYIEGYQLDKDFLVAGNKHYSPETCVFIPQQVNSFICTGTNSKRGHLLGSVVQNGKFYSRVMNPFTKKMVHLGVFDTELQAHLAWKSQKHEYAIKLIAQYPNLQESVKQALRTKYAHGLKLVSTQPTNLDFLQAA